MNCSAKLRFGSIGPFAGVCEVEGNGDMLVSIHLYTTYQLLQLSFFQLDDPLLSSLRDDLVNVDINNLTPLQAFDILRSMKEKLGIGR